MKINENDLFCSQETTPNSDVVWKLRRAEEEFHHITPKYLGGDKNGPLIPLDGAYHQVITNEFRTLWPYGKGIPSALELQNIMEQVYSKYPLPPGH